MVIVLKHDIKLKDKLYIKSFLEDKGFKIKEIIGEEETILGAVGIVSIDIREVEILPGVAQVIPISKPYKLASREFKAEDTIISVGGLKIGGPRITVAAGPCAVESRQQIIEVAYAVRESGAVLLRGGAFKPRSSPYSFQGLGEKGLIYLKEASEETGLPIISEIVSPLQADMMKRYVDIIQIGARNMHNFELLKTVGSLEKPVLLKRGLAATIEELLMSAEYLLAHGTDNVILCERGIRTFETYTRNTLDLSAIPVVKKLSHLPIIVDPSHATGLRQKVLPMALAAIAAGADGLIVEVHIDPDHALSDGPQSLYLQQFEKLMRDIEALSPVIEKEISRLPEKVSVPQRPDVILTERKQNKQEELMIAFQGERGAFSEKAIHRYFSIPKTLIPCSTFRDVFENVLTGKALFGVIPLENSLSGSIHENYDLLLQYPDIKIAGEKKIRIIHNLITIPGADYKDIKRIYSHPQGLAQCSKFIGKYPHWETVAYYDTAGSVAFIAQLGKKENAAIASEEAAKVYKMQILKKGIETNASNYTRFVIIGHESMQKEKKPNKASIVFSAKDEPGSLFQCLQVLAEKKLNMTKLESRPIMGKPWEYMFYVDLDVPEKIDLFYEAIELLKNKTEDLCILGIYKS
jgi:3-deoxy-7-phosphoheptulonate synthase